jgi:hypothetical protein
VRPHRERSAPRRLAVVPDPLPEVAPEAVDEEALAQAELTADIEAEVARSLAESLTTEIAGGPPRRAPTTSSCRPPAPATTPRWPSC